MFICSDRFVFKNIALEVSKFEPPVLSEVPKVAGLWLLLARLVDPQNLGSIIRSAAFFGAAGVLTGIKGGCDYTPTVSKASAGTMETFESLYRVKSVSSFLQVSTAHTLINDLHATNNHYHFQL